MELYHTTDADGISILNPDEEAMRDLLERLDDPGADEAEHPDVTLMHDPSAWSVSVFPSGTITLENLNEPDGAPRFMLKVSRVETLKVWIELSRGEIEKVQSRPWINDADGAAAD